MNRRISMFNGALLAGLIWLGFGFLPAAQAADPCGLFAKADAEALFKEKVSDPVSRAAMTPAGITCRYSFSKNGGSYGLKIRLCDDAGIKEEGIYDSAADLMSRQKKARQNSAQAAKGFQEIPNLGDQAFWNGSDLWLLAGKYLVIVSVNSPLSGSFPSGDALEKAKAEQNLGLSLQVARIMLPRLP